MISSQDGLRFLLTLLVSLRGIKLAPKLDLTPIEQPWAGSIPSMSSNEQAHLVRVLGLRPTSPKWTEFHVSAAKGPSGQATIMAINELRFLPDNLLDDLIILGGSKLSDTLMNLSRPLEENSKLSLMDM